MSADHLQRVGNASWVDVEHVVAVIPHTKTTRYESRSKILLDSGAEFIVMGAVDDVVKSLT